MQSRRKVMKAGLAAAALATTNVTVHAAQEGRSRSDTSGELPSQLTVLSIRQEDGRETLGVKTQAGVLDVAAASKLLGYSPPLSLEELLTKGGNAELKALVEAGADLIQIDEPSAAIVTGELKEYIKLFNAAVEGVKAKIAYHVCFGNLASRPRGKREYAWMLPELLNARCDQLVLEFANREMKEVELLKEIAADREVGVGVVDVKSFYVEPPEEVAQRICLVLKYVPAEKLTLVPDCGFFQLPRWLTALKLNTLAQGARIVRGELAGRAAVSGR